jgi:hypothetical protein
VVESGGNECGEKLVIWGDWGATWGWQRCECRFEAELGVCKWRAGLGMRRERLDWGLWKTRSSYQM